MMNKAFRSLKAANQHMATQDYDFASSRAYYAVFYAIEALLLTKNLPFSKHGNVIGAFNKHFIKTSIFPKEYSKWIARLFRERQTGDYEFEFVISEDDANKDIN